MDGPLLPEPLELSFVSEDLDPLDWEAVEPYVEELLERDLRDEGGLRQFLSDWNELFAVVVERRNQLRVDKACDTEDEATSEAWSHVISEIQPKLQRASHRLGRAVVDSPGVDALEGTVYDRFLRETRTEVALFEQDNVPLEQELAELSTEYGEVTGGWTIEFEGESYTLSGIRQFYQHPDRSVRRRAWEATAERRVADRESLDEMFDQMLDLRRQVADNAGFDDYRAYAFRQKLRDYGPEQCRDLHELIASEVRPLAEEIVERKCEGLGLETYRPWDKMVDPAGEEPLRPFEEADELEEGVARMMQRLDPELGEQFQAIRSSMDLEARPNKEQGGFSIELPRSRRPFIFANAAGQHHDVTTLLHEAGHAFHSLAYRGREPMASAWPPIEFCEVASMAMEMLHYETLDEFYDEAERRRAVEQHLRRIPRLLLSVARGDAFQHWLYTAPEHDADERDAKWRELGERYTPYVETDDLPETWTSSSWQMISHFFQNPFYFIEYGFAQLGALQVAVRASEEPEAALADYKRALALGTRRDVEGLYEAAGAQFVPTRETVARSMQWIRDRLFD